MVQNLKATAIVSVCVFLDFFVMDKYGTKPNDTELLCVCLFVIDQCGANLKVIAPVCVFVSVNEMVQYVANLEATVLVVCVYVCVYVCVCDYLIWSQPGCHSSGLSVRLCVCL